LKYILIILFAFTVNAQTVWYVDRDATGANTGRSWTDAWTDFDSVDYWGNGTGINWAIIGAGDSIYVSGGSDSTVYNTNSPSGIVIGDIGGLSQNYTFANQVVIANAYHSGHDGDVYLISDADGDDNVLAVGNISNIKITGFNIWDRRTLTGGGMVKLGNADWDLANGGSIDSLIVVDNCHIYAKGFASLITLSGTKNTISNCMIETQENYFGFEQDQFGINGGRGGHTIINNTMIARYRFANLNHSANGAVTITANSLTDTRLNMTTNAYLGTFVMAGDTAYMIVTSNDNDTFNGTGGWLVVSDASPSGTPPNGTAYDHNTDAHRDGIQQSNVGYPYGADSLWRLNNERLTNTIANNLYIDYYPEGTGMNNMIYNYGWTVTTDARFNIYNNILVNRKNADGIGGIAIGRYYVGSYSEWNSIYILNNTIISGGTSGSMFTFWSADTLVMANNLWIKDTEAPNILNLENGQSLWENVVRYIDYNRYFESGGQSNPFAANVDSVNWADWNDNFDQHSDYRNSTEVTFTSKYDTNKVSYYTTAGRDSAIDLSATYPFLSTDALGNSRSGTWDIGALEYQDGAWTPPDTTATVSFTAVTNAVRDGYYTTSGVLSGADSTFHIYTATADSFKIGVLGTYDLTAQEADNGDTVYISNIASSLYSALTTSSIIVSGTTRSFNVTTLAEPDTTPSAFTFTDITGATRSTVYTSNLVTFIGFDSAYAYAGGAEYTINGGSYRTEYTKIFNNDNARVRLTSSGSYSAGTSVTLTAGGVSDTYTVTTLAEPVAADTIPNSFNFTDVVNANLSTAYTSASITLAGFDSAYAYAGGALYSVNGGSFVTGYTRVYPTNQIRMRLTTRANYLSLSGITLIVGGVQDMWTVKTRASGKKYIMSTK